MATPKRVADRSGRVAKPRNCADFRLRGVFGRLKGDSVFWNSIGAPSDKADTENQDKEHQIGGVRDEAAGDEPRFEAGVQDGGGPVEQPPREAHEMNNGEDCDGTRQEISKVKHATEVICDCGKALAQSGRIGETWLFAAPPHRRCGPREDAAPIAARPP